MAEPRRLKAYTLHTSNNGIAASTEEEVFNQDFTGKLDKLSIGLDMDNATGTLGSSIKILIDGVDFLGTSLTTTIRKFGIAETIDVVNTAPLQGALGTIIESTAATKVYRFLFDIDTEVCENVTISIANADATNAISNVHIGVKYYVEI